jgi:hypothetical protein
MLYFLGRVSIKSPDMQASFEKSNIFWWAQHPTIIACADGSRGGPAHHTNIFVYNKLCHIAYLF